MHQVVRRSSRYSVSIFFEKQHLIRTLTHPAYANELLQQKTLLMDQVAYSTLADAVLKPV